MVSQLFRNVCRQGGYEGCHAVFLVKADLLLGGPGGCLPYFWFASKPSTDLQANRVLICKQTVYWFASKPSTDLQANRLAVCMLKLVPQIRHGPGDSLLHRWWAGGLDWGASWLGWKWRGRRRFLLPGKLHCDCIMDSSAGPAETQNDCNWGQGTIWNAVCSLLYRHCVTYRLTLLLPVSFLLVYLAPKKKWTPESHLHESLSRTFFICLDFE